MPPGTVIPAIIPESREALERELERLGDITSAFQIDIVDGKFVPFTSWPYTNGGAPERVNALVSNLKIEFDLMIQAPEETLHEWLATDAARFVIHVESTEDAQICIERIKDAKKKVGLALNNDTPFSTVERHIAAIDYVQCMGIATIGKQGEGFDDRVLARVSEIRSAYPGLEIAVDGSVNLDTIERIYEAGATRLVSGSAILNAESPIGAYNELLKRVS